MQSEEDQKVQSVTRGVFAEGGVVWNNNVADDPKYNFAEDGRLTKSLLAIAIIDKVGPNAGVVKGFLQMRNKIDLNAKGQGNADSGIDYKYVDFTDEDISMSTFLIDQSQAKIQGKVEEKLMVDQIDNVLRHSESETNNAAATLEIIGVFMDKAKVLIGADRCSLFLVDDIRGELCTAHASATNAGTVLRGNAAEPNSRVSDGEDQEKKLVIRLPMGQGLVGACADIGKDINIVDCQTDNRFDKASDKKTGYKTMSMLCVPIKNSVGQVLGVVQMLNKTDSSFQVVPFTEEDARKLRGIASKATVAIEKAQMFSKLQLIMDATNKINASSMDLDVLVARTMSSARRLLNADRCTLFLLDQSTNELYSHITDEDDTGLGESGKKEKNLGARKFSEASADSGGNVGEKGITITKRAQAKITFAATKGIAGKAVITKDSVNCEDVYEDPTFNRAVDEQTGYRTKSVMCVPVMNSTGEVLGVAQMINKMDHGGDTVTFSDQDEKLLRAFISQVAVAITNNQLFSHVFDTLSLNLSILSSLPYVVLALAGDGSFVECNRPLRDVLNVDLKDTDVLKQHYSEWLTAAPQKILEVIQDVVEKKIEIKKDFDTPVKSGDYTYLSIHANPIVTTGEAKDSNRGYVIVMRCESTEGHRRTCQSVSEDQNSQKAAIKSNLIQKTGSTVLESDEGDY